MSAGRDPNAFWTLSLCQVVHVLHTLSGGRRRTANGRPYRKGNAADLMAMFGGYSNVGKYRVGPEGSEAPPVP